MDWPDFQLTMDALEGRALSMQLCIHNPGPGTLPGRQDDHEIGILKRRHPSEWDELWWTLPEAAYFDLAPHSAFYVPRSRFLGARWDGLTLVIERRSHDTQLTMLSRARTGRNPSLREGNNERSQHRRLHPD